MKGQANIKHLSGLHKLRTLAEEHNQHIFY